MRVLALDTSSSVIGVGLWADGSGIARTERVQRGAEARLVPWAMALCEVKGMRLQDLDAIAIAAGPGAFTGLRVGMATAVGLATGLERPLWSASSLLARGARVGGDVLVMLDARKGRVYAGWYREGRIERGPADVPPQEALCWPEGPFMATGEGALAYRPLVLAAGGTVVDDADSPAVEDLARLGAIAVAHGEGKSPFDAHVFYVRAPDARLPGSR